MHTPRILAFTAAAVLGAARLSPLLLGVQPTTEPIGFTTTSLLAESDSFISLPLIRPPAYVGSIQSASGTTITVSGTPWTQNQFVYAAGAQPNHYYALIGPASSANAKEGHTYPILANGSSTLTVELAQDDLNGIPANARVSVVPNWTPATAFPSSDQNVSFTPTTASAVPKTQLRVPDTTAAGTNLPFTTYFFSSNVDGTSANVGWRISGDNTTDHGDDPLLPDSYFVVRNQNGAPTLPLVTPGGVLMSKLAIPLMTDAKGAQDNPVSLLRPIDVSLNATGLNPGDGSFTTADRLLLFNNAQPGFDKSPAAVYYLDPAAPNGPWRREGDTASDRGGDVIPSGTGFVIRKGLGSGQPAFWTNSFPVQAASIVSRKTHGVAGDFDIDLPLSGTPGIECRGNGTDHKVVFTFPGAVTYTGVQVTSGAVTGATATTNSANVVSVNLSGVADGQWVTVTLLGVNDGSNTNNVAVRMGVLAGDTNGSGSVSASDVAQVKSFSGQTVMASNFRGDVVPSDAINASDIGLVKSKSGAFLPAP